MKRKREEKYVIDNTKKLLSDEVFYNDLLSEIIIGYLNSEELKELTSTNKYFEEKTDKEYNVNFLIKFLKLINEEKDKILSSKYKININVKITKDFSITDLITCFESFNTIRSVGFCECKQEKFNFNSRIHTLDLSYCHRITDVRALGGVHTLNLSNCPGITDVSSLGGVHTLDLSDCQGITNVSDLRGVHDLDLSNCQGITNVSALGRVHTLNLSNTGVEDVSALGGVHTLNLSNTGVEDVSALGGVHSLDLSYCEDITDVSSLNRVHTLYLIDTNVTDISVLTGVHTLKLGSEIIDESLKDLTSVTDLFLIGVAYEEEDEDKIIYTGKIDLQYIKENVKCLSLQYYRYISNLDKLTKLETLKLFECHINKDILESLKKSNINTLFIEDCKFDINKSDLNTLTKKIIFL